MKRNKFKRALHHLNKKNVVESAPTNSTLGVFSITPSGVGPVGWTDRTFTTDISGNPLPKIPVADFTVGENPQNATEARDTSGLFEDDGTIKTLTPPGDNSYILGPFSSMWYAWGNFTTLGYIRQADRKMVNLGTITGKLSDWDGSSINSYGQLTLEQALWFKDVKKFGDIDNDPANHNYRAFYPGPPSNVADSNGRYLCVIAASRQAGGEETRPAPPVNPTQKGAMGADDNFSAQSGKNKRGIGARGNRGRGEKFDTSDFADNLNKALTIADIALTAVSIAGILFPEPTTSAAGVAGLANVLGKLRLLNKGRKGLGLAKGLKGMKVGATGLKSGGFKALKGGKGLHSGSKGLLSPGGKGVYSAPKVGKVGPSSLKPGTGGAKYSKYGSNPFSSFSKGGKGTGSSPGGVVGSIVPGGARGIKIFEPQSVVKPSTFKKGSKLFKKVMEGGYGKSATANKIRKMATEAGFGSGQSSIPFSKLPKLMNSYDYDGFYLIESVVSDEEQNEMIMQMSENPKLMKKLPQIIKELENELELSKLFVLLFGDEGKQQVKEQKNSYTYSKQNLLREIVIPEAKKKYKVKPKVLGHPSNKTLSNQMKDTTPNVAFKKEIPVWSMDQKIRNARSSQEKKNEVLEYLGSSGDHWDYMTKTIKEHNKKIIKLNYGGKKKKVTRKEQVDKDTLVFMEDELGNKSSVLQSKINEMQAEAGDKEMFAKYYEMHPQKKSLFKEVVKRGVFDYKGKPSKKGYPDKEPAQLDPNTGMHPEYGKKVKHDKLDPHSAEGMPMQGDPEIDANISKNVDQEKKKRKSKILSQPNG